MLGAHKLCFNYEQSICHQLFQQNTKIECESSVDMYTQVLSMQVNKSSSCKFAKQNGLRSCLFELKSPRALEFHTQWPSHKMQMSIFNTQFPRQNRSNSSENGHIQSTATSEFYCDFGSWNTCP